MASAIPPTKPVILVVDDEPLLRMAVLDLLDEAGFDTVEAANADEAIALLETRSDIRVIVTDIDMPRGSMNGLKLAAAVHDGWPPIKIIIVSGHCTPGALELPEGSVFFPKPYPHRTLIRQIQEFAA